MALGIFATFECIAEGRPAEPAANWKALKAERGYVYPSYFAKLVPHLDGGIEEKLSVLLRFNEEEPGPLREGIAAELFRRRGESFDQDYLAARNLVESVEPGGFGGYQLGFGPLLVDWHGDDLIGCLLMTQSKGMDAPLLAEALGRTGRGVSPRGSDISLEAVEELLLEDLAIVKDRAGAVPFARGVGWRLHRVLHRMVYQPWRAGAFIDSAPPALRDSVRMGYMEAARQGRLNASP